jgi:hypothetical protein
MNGFFGKLPKPVVDGNNRPATGRPIEQRPLFDLLPEHGFEAKCLSTQLYFVCTVYFWLAALVLNRVGPVATIDDMELHHIGDTCDPQSRVGQGHCRDGAHSVSLLDCGVIGPIVEQPPFGGLAVVRPQALDVDQRALPRAVKVMLEGGNGDQVIIIHYRPRLASQAFSYDNAARQCLGA